MIILLGIILAVAIAVYVVDWAYVKAWIADKTK